MPSKGVSKSGYIKGREPPRPRMPEPSPSDFYSPMTDPTDNSRPKPAETRSKPKKGVNRSISPGGSSPMTDPTDNSRPKPAVQRRRR